MLQRLISGKLTKPPARRTSQSGTEYVTACILAQTGPAKARKRHPASAQAKAGTPTGTAPSRLSRLRRPRTVLRIPAMPSKKRTAYITGPKPSHPWRKQASPETAARRINLREKGASSEREFARLIEEQLGVRLVRNLEQSRSGGHDLEPMGDDPAALALGRFAIEVKRHAAITPAKLAEFWKQAEEQAKKAARTPVLALREVLPLCALNANFGAWEGIEWAAALSVPAFCALVREMAALGGTENTSIDGRTQATTS